MLARLSGSTRGLPLLLALAASFFALSCGDSDDGGGTGTGPDTPVAVSATLSPSSADLETGQSVTFTITVRFDDGSTQNFSGTWTSSDPSVAPVTTTGIVTGLAAGTATITGTAQGQSASATVTVTDPPVASVEVTPGSATLAPGETSDFEATTRSSSGAILGGRTVTWASSDDAVATVDANGLVTAVAEGTATITATSEGQSGSATVTVRRVVSQVQIAPVAASVLIGATQQLTATALDPQGDPITGRAETWASLDASIASVDASGLVTGVGAGTVAVTVTIDGVVGQSTITVTDVPVATVEVAPLAAAVEVGESRVLVATVKDAGGNTLSGRTVTWSSSDPAVASVDANGQITGVAEGSATVTATSEGKTGTATITVIRAAVSAVAVTPQAPSVVANQTQQLTATVTDSRGAVLTGRVVTWSSASTGVATVDANGLVTAVSPGTAVITATSEGVSGSATVTVTAAPVATVEVAPTSASVQVGGTQQLTATTKDAGGNTLSGRTVTWSTSDATVATVDANGLVTGVADGTATITATSEGQTATSTITVTAVPVASVEVAPPSASIVVGATQQLTATTKDAGGNTLSGRTVAWTSSDETVATVDANGLVTGVAAGTATITATSEGQTGTATITVTPKPVATVEVAPNTPSVVQFATQQLTATTKDAEGNVLAGRTVTWASSDASVATVDGNGLVTAVAAGTATITATSEGQSGTATVTVTAAPVATVEVAPTSASIQVGGTQQLTATTKAAGGQTLTGRTVTWSTSDASVATVSTSGLVTGAGAGTATITATSEGQTGTSTITVTAVPAGSVEVAPFGGSFGIGNSMKLTGTVKDGSGNVLGSTPTWSSSNTGVATVDANGLVTGVGVGSASITASSGGQQASVNVTITNPGNFSITLIYVNDVAPADRAVFDQAAARWSSIVTNDLPDSGDPGACGSRHGAVGTTVDDVTVFVETYTGELNGTLASAGACWLRGSNFPLTGTMRFDLLDLPSLRSANALEGTVLHEMGHVLGIGSLWDRFSLTTGTSAATCEASRGADPVFTGTAAIAAFDAAGGSGRATKVPVENTGSFEDGSNCGHWRESTMDTELMTPFLDSGSDELSLITIQSLADMGYSVNTGGADSYTVPNPLSAAIRVPTGPVFDLRGDLLRPILRLEVDGSTTDLREPGRRR